MIVKQKQQKPKFGFNLRLNVTIYLRNKDESYIVHTIKF